MTETAGPCPKCGSADTKRYAVKRPRPGDRGGHRCTPECESTERLCLACRLVTPMKEEPMTFELPDELFGRAEILPGDKLPEDVWYRVGDDVGPKFDNVAAAIMHEWSLYSTQDETSGDAQYGNGWHALFRSERAILQTVNSGAAYSWRVPDNEDIDEVWAKIEAGAVYPDDPDDNEE